MSSPVKRISLLFVFLAAIAFHLLLSFMWPHASIPFGNQTLIYALFAGALASIVHIPLLWVFSKYHPQYMGEVLVWCLGYIIVGRVQDVWYWENPVLCGLASVLVSLAVILGVYQWLVRKIRSKNESEEQPK